MVGMRFCLPVYASTGELLLHSFLALPSCAATLEVDALHLGYLALVLWLFRNRIALRTLRNKYVQRNKRNAGADVALCLPCHHLCLMCFQQPIESSILIFQPSTPGCLSGCPCSTSASSAPLSSTRRRSSCSCQGSTPARCAPTG